MALAVARPKPLAPAAFLACLLALDCRCLSAAFSLFALAFPSSSGVIPVKNKEVSWVEGERKIMAKTGRRDKGIL